MVERLIEVTRDLSGTVGALRFEPPVAVTYNPLDYAQAPHELYLRRFGAGAGRVVLLGMNPGPWGMAQTGVPFGEVASVRDWMGIDAPVRRPDPEHPKRKVLGLAQTRSEVSGRRLWGWAAERYVTSEAFFARFFVLNYCPLSFMDARGRNIVPEKLPVSEREPLFAACDAALRDMVDALEPERVLGVGTFAEARAKRVVGDRVAIGRVLHPSPASPKANRGWARQAEAELLAQGITL